MEDGKKLQEPLLASEATAHTAVSIPVGMGTPGQPGAWAAGQAATGMMQGQPVLVQVVRPPPQLSPQQLDELKTSINLLTLASICLLICSIFLSLFQAAWYDPSFRDPMMPSLWAFCLVASICCRLRRRQLVYRYNRAVSGGAALPYGIYF